jgi:hypothetical protein
MMFQNAVVPSIFNPYLIHANPTSVSVNFGANVDFDFFSSWKQSRQTMTFVSQLILTQRCSIEMKNCQFTQNSHRIEAHVRLSIETETLFYIRCWCEPWLFHRVHIKIKMKN